TLVVGTHAPATSAHSDPATRPADLRELQSFSGGYVLGSIDAQRLASCLRENCPSSRGGHDQPAQATAVPGCVPVAYRRRTPFTRGDAVGCGQTGSNELPSRARWRTRDDAMVHGWARGRCPVAREPAGTGGTPRHDTVHGDLRHRH